MCSILYAFLDYLHELNDVLVAVIGSLHVK